MDDKVKDMVASISKKIVLVDSGLYKIASILYLSAGINIVTGIAGASETLVMLMASALWIGAGATQFYVANAVKICWEEGIRELLNIEKLSARKPVRYYVQERTTHEHPSLLVGSIRPKLGFVVFTGSVLTACLLAGAVFFTIGAYGERSIQTDDQATMLAEIRSAQDSVEVRLKRIETHLSDLLATIDSLIEKHVVSRDVDMKVDSSETCDKKLK